MYNEVSIFEKSFRLQKKTSKIFVNTGLLHNSYEGISRPYGDPNGRYGSVWIEPMIKIVNNHWIDSQNTYYVPKNGPKPMC